MDSREQSAQMPEPGWISLVAGHTGGPSTGTESGYFLSRMSHELRTPLNVILGFAQVLTLSELTPDQKESVAQILKAGRQLLALVDDVLELSGLQARELPVADGPVAIGTVVDEVIEAFRARASAEEVELRTRGPEGDVVAAGDRTYIRAVLVNLVSNGVKYGGRGGIVTVGWRAEGGSVRVEVSDTGPGIPAARQRKLFDPFERLGAEASEIEGTGLGLTLARGLVEAMGGSLTLESAPGKGATFTFALPAFVEAPGER
jgi:signal transduction histidine kinase